MLLASISCCFRIWLMWYSLDLANSRMLQHFVSDSASHFISNHGAARNSASMNCARMVVLSCPSKKHNCIAMKRIAYDLHQTFLLPSKLSGTACVLGHHLTDDETLFDCCTRSSDLSSRCTGLVSSSSRCCSRSSKPPEPPEMPPATATAGCHAVKATNTLRCPRMTSDWHCLRT